MRAPRALLLLALLLIASPTHAKRKKAHKGKGKAESAEHARLLSERDRLLAALAKAEQGCDASAEVAPLQSKARPALQPVQLTEFSQRGYTVVRGVVPGDVATSPCHCLTRTHLSHMQRL